MINKLLIFDLKGKLACWKKFYSNSSSLTYDIPTRTNLIGILASVLELPRDSYYNALNSSNCKISLSIKSNFKKKFHCLNYFQKPNIRKYTQVRLETLMPINIQNGELKYRIYVWLGDEKLFEELIARIKKGNYGYGIYLGQRQFRGHIEFIDLIDKSNGENIKYVENVNALNSITNTKNVDRESLIVEEGEELEIEKMPLDFIYTGPEKEYIKDNNKLNRELQNVGEIIYIRNADHPLKTNKQFNRALKIHYNSSEENIAFYENDF